MLVLITFTFVEEIKSKPHNKLVHKNLLFDKSSNAKILEEKIRKKTKMNTANFFII